MTNDFRSYNVIYIVYDRKNENHWSLLVTHYSLLITHYSEYKHPITEFLFTVAIVTLKPHLVKGLFHAFVSCHAFDLG